jgi:hypothetical protein
VNQQADRIAGELAGALTWAAVSRVLAEEVTDGKALPEAVFATLSRCRGTMGRCVLSARCRTSGQAR